MPDTLQDLSPSALITAIGASEIAYYRNFSRLPDAELFDEPNLLWLASGLPVFNTVLHAHTTEEKLGPEIERVVAYFRSRKLAFNWYVGPLSQPANIREHLPRYGVQHDEDEPGMALDLYELNEDVPLAPALVIQQVTSDELLLQWLHTWGFPVPEDYIQHFFAAYQSLYGENEPLRFFLGFLDGRPVATSALFEGAGVARVEHVVTVPDVRRQGIGATMTLAALHEARALGYRVSVLRASPYGIHMYRRLGFREYCMMSTYVWSPQDAP